MTVTIPLSEYIGLKQSVYESTKALNELQVLVKSLQEEIRLLKNGRNSNTSSTPPSQDYKGSKQKSLREPSTREPGGQKGHEGTNLKMVAIADQIIEYRPEFCQLCGQKLDISEANLEVRKQEMDIPVIAPKVIEYQSYSCNCKSCGYLTRSQLPEHLHANIQYGPQISALIGYFSVRQYLPYNRIAEMMGDVFNAPLSQGTVDNILQRLSLKATSVYEQIKLKVEQSDVIGGDETGIKINGKKGWLFTFQTKTLNFLTVSFSRGFDTIQSSFKNGFPTSVYVTDCWAAQLKTQAKAHQICLAHLQRELNNFIDSFSCSWSKQLKELFNQTLEFKRQLQPNEYYENQKVKTFERQLDLLLKTNPDDKNKKVKAFIKRLNKNRNSIFTFLYYHNVPPDNNASEQSVRNAKVKMKVSNQFKTLEGAKRFAILRSVVDTTIKNSQNVLNAFFNLSYYSAE